MKLTTEVAGNAAILRVEGDIDLCTSPALRQAILEAVKKEMTPIVINLSCVTYMDSSGVATLVEGFQLSREYKGVVRLVGLTERVAEVFKLARLHQVFELCQTETEALGPQPEP